MYISVYLFNTIYNKFVYIVNMILVWKYIDYI